MTEIYTKIYQLRVLLNKIKTSLRAADIKLFRLRFSKQVQSSPSKWMVALSKT